MSNSFDDPIGAPLIGTWFNILLFAYEVVEISKYYTRYPKDPLSVKILVAILFLVDLGEVLCTCIFVYLYAVSFWGQPQALLKQYWPSPAYLTLSSLNTLLVQMFLVSRYWILTKHLYVVIVLALLSLIAVTGELGSGIAVALYPTYAEREKAVLPSSIWLIATAVVDVLIAATLVIELRSMRLSYKSTRRMVKNLVYRSISTGSMTAVMAIIIVALFSYNHESNISVGFAFFLGRVYAISMLFNLNGRRRDDSSNATTDIHTLSDQVTGHDLGIFNVSGIQVHSVVHTDVTANEQFVTPVKGHQGVSFNDYQNKRLDAKILDVV